jgi:hypothetical protein
VSINDNTTGTAANQFQYVGGSDWVYEQRGDTYQGDDHYDDHAGDAYRVSFSGTEAQIYTSKDAGLGIMAVSIDGGSETMVDLYSSSRLTQQLVYTSPQLANGTHTLKVRVTGNQNPSAAHAFVSADRVDITGGPAPTVSLAANPASISSGQSSTLSWSASNANSCSAPWTSQTGTSGSQSVSPTATTTYTVTCIGGGGSTSRSTTVSVSASTSPPPPGPCAGSPAPLGGYQHVVWVVMENHSYNEIVGNSAAPFENELASECGLATNYFAISHPSLPNYVAMTSGSTQGIADDNDPSSHPLNVASIFSQLAGGASRSLEEGMPSSCAQTSSGEYAVKHNPMAYYTNLSSGCANYDVPLGATPDLTAKFTFVTPNLIDDMHDGTIAQGDAWLHAFMGQVFSTPQWQAGNTAVFITFDEDDSSQNNQVYTAVIAPSVKPGTQSSTYFSHYSLLRTTEDLLGLSAIGNAAAATAMEQAFNLGTH